MAFMAPMVAPMIASVAGSLVSNAMQSGNKNNASFQAQAPGLIGNPGQMAAQNQNAYEQTGNALNSQRAMVGQMQSASPEIFAQQQGLANQLQQQSMGQGPNPALQQLQNTTGQNIAGQNALMAGQRGAGANAGLMARQAGQIGGNIQQQAAGQGALMAAQQQLSAQQQLAAQQSQIAQQQIGSNQNYGSQAANFQGMLQNQIGNLNNNMVGAGGNVNSTNQAMSNTNAIGQQHLIGGIAGGVGSALSAGIGAMGAGNSNPTGYGTNDTSMAAGGHAHGGMIGYAQGGAVANKGPKSELGKYCMNMQVGGSVPGQAKTAGDNLKNDTVPAMLSPGEVVIPRSVMNGKNPAQDSAKFVAAILAKKGMR